MENRRVRIIDIAEELGLSTATVSNVIHGKTKKISDETVKRVQELLEKRQYIPSMAGILLARNDSRIIGVVVNDHEKYEGHVLEDGFISAALNALSAQMDESGFFLMLKTTKDWCEIEKFASMWNMEGMVLIGFCEQDYKKLREKMHIPFVVYDGYFREAGNLVNITVDHFDGGVQAGRYLSEMGHTKVLCISDNDVCMDRDRFYGLKKILPQAELMVVPMKTEERHRFYVKNMERIRSVTAVFAVSDYYAIDLIYFLSGRGIAVPADISVIGFDDCLAARQIQPQLTTIRQDNQMRARTALRVLQELKGAGVAAEQVRLPVFLVKRASVADRNKE